jgi:hypothetical protein
VTRDALKARPRDVRVDYEVTAAGSGTGLAGSGPPDAVEVGAHRAALTLLRPQLATVWLDAVAAPAGWPTVVVREVEAVRARMQPSQRPREPGRPGRSPQAVALDAAADDDFALACALAPYTTAVEAMSRRGQIVYARLRPTEPLRLRLAPEDRAALDRSVPGLASRLTPVDAVPTRSRRRVPGSSSRHRLLSIAMVCFGPINIVPAIERLLSQPGVSTAVFAAIAVTGGGYVSVVGARDLWPRVRPAPPPGPT